YVCATLVVILVGGVRTVAAQSRKSIELNEIAFTFAAKLIKKGQDVADSKGAWSKDRPSVQQENEFIRRYGFAEYAKWHLGIDRLFPDDTKRRYRFPYGDFKNVHRCGLLAVKARAAEYKYHDIENAAARLIGMTLPGRGEKEQP